MLTFDRPKQHIVNELNTRLDGHGKLISQQASELFNTKYVLLITRLALLATVVTLVAVVYLWASGAPVDAIEVCRL